jgi:ParB family chromosome partitioning protein
MSTAIAAPSLRGLGNNLAELLNQKVQSVAGPIELNLSLIDEDPKQPRGEDNPGFSSESLGELAATITARGVKSPISVRENPDAPGRYLINHGARRYRGSKIAGKTTIPAFVDNDYNDDDQVIENLQRNELTPREIANFIGRELSKGRKRGDIAKALGKSAPWVTQHAALLDLPDPIAEAFNSGRTNDVTVINELVRAYKDDAEKVGTWLTDESQEITRGSVKTLREFIDDEGAEGDGTGGDTGSGEGDGAADGGEDNAKKKKEPAEVDPTKLKKAIVVVLHDERQGRLLLGQRPSAEGLAWIKYDDDGHEFEAALDRVQLVAVIEG